MFQHLHSCESFKFLFSLTNLPGCFNNKVNVANFTSHVHQTIFNNATIIACNNSYNQLCFQESWGTYLNLTMTLKLPKSLNCFRFRFFDGSKGGAVVKVLASHQCGPGSNPGADAICGLSLLLVLSLAPRGFSPGTPVFPSPQKPTFPNSNSTMRRNQVDEEPLCGCATCKIVIYSLFIYLILILAFLLYFPPHSSHNH